MSRPNPTRTLQDVETEEVLHVLTPKIRRHRQPFTMIFCDALLALLSTEGRRDEDDSGMTLVHLRVLLYLLGSTEYENRLERFVTEIADDLGHDRSTVSKALDFLEERDLIRRTSAGPGAHSRSTSTRRWRSGGRPDSVPQSCASTGRTCGSPPHSPGRRGGRPRRRVGAGGARWSIGRGWWRGGRASARSVA